MVFYQAVQALLNLDIGFFLTLIREQLVWVALFYSIIVILYDNKRTLYYFFLLGIYIWVFLDFVNLTGLGWGLVGGGIWIVLRTIIVESGETTLFLRKYFNQVWTIASFAILLYVAFFR